MKENQRSGMDNQQDMQNDQLRGNTMNETIRDVSGDRNETLRDADMGSGRSYDYGTQGSEETDNLRSDAGDMGGGQGVGGGRSRENVAGTADMKDEQITGAGRDVRRRQGSGQNLAPKLGTTGSHFDGQNSI